MQKTTAHFMYFGWEDKAKDQMEIKLEKTTKTSAEFGNFLLCTKEGNGATRQGREHGWERRKGACRRTETTPKKAIVNVPEVRKQP